MDQKQCSHQRWTSYQYIESDRPVRICEDCGEKIPSGMIVSPYDMGRMLAEALGLQDVRGIMRLAVIAEGGHIPRIEVTRMMTEHEAGVYCALLKEWKCKILPGQCWETPISAQDAAGVRAGQPSETTHPARD